jgi:hypothetical protein
MRNESGPPHTTKRLATLEIATPTGKTFTFDDVKGIYLITPNSALRKSPQVDDFDLSVGKNSDRGGYNTYVGPEQAQSMDVFGE